MSVLGIGYGGMNRYAAYGQMSMPNAVGRPDDMEPPAQIGAVECQTCKGRKYQDGSNDPGVSFKAPGHIDPANAQSVVRSHEREHVANERAKARTQDSKVVSQSVRLFTSVCPECGRTYVSGGLTRTVTASADRQTQGFPSKGGGRSFGRFIDVTV
ncbi:hypothetical protein ACH6CV_00105 [Bacillota bacterium Meth-B3]